VYNTEFHSSCNVCCDKLGLSDTFVSDLQIQCAIFTSLFSIFELNTTEPIVPHNYCFFLLFPSSGILENTTTFRKLSVSLLR
jgi:hypothetical protein